MSGAFQTSREIFDNPIWKNIVDFRLFFLVYGQAVFSTEGVRLADDLVLQRGQWCRSLRKIQEDLTYVENRQIKTYSLSVLNRCIKRAVDSQRLCTRTHELGTVFTVVNYELYQGFGAYKKNNLEQDLEQSGNSEGTVGEQSGNNNKNVNNAINVMNEEIKRTTTILESDDSEELGSYQANMKNLLETYGRELFDSAFKEGMKENNTDLSNITRLLQRYNIGA